MRVCWIGLDYLPRVEVIHTEEGTGLKRGGAREHCQSQDEEDEEEGEEEEEEREHVLAEMILASTIRVENKKV